MGRPLFPKNQRIIANFGDKGSLPWEGLLCLVFDEKGNRAQTNTRAE